jgi:hypothetical protein
MHEAMMMIMIIIIILFNFLSHAFIVAVCRQS